jgi:acyl-CoA synthetase (AMP-forming)/AMP-acid ligase II
MLDKEGNLHLVGRLADVIRSGGEKIMAVEVERVLLDHPLVEGVAVIGVPDKKFGERAVAVVVLGRKEGEAPGGREGGGGGGGRDGGREGGLGEELQAHCRRFLAGYKVPKEVVFREVLPLTGSGKVRKAVLVKELSVKAQEEEEMEKCRSFL